MAAPQPPREDEQHLGGVAGPVDHRLVVVVSLEHEQRRAHVRGVALRLAPGEQGRRRRGGSRARTYTEKPAAAAAAAAT